MRENQTLDSSFDLFLDTICNTFGGIVFLAILLAIMIQSKAATENVQQQSQVVVSEEEYRDLSQKLVAVQNEYETISKALAALPDDQQEHESVAYLNAIQTLEQQLEEQGNLVAEQLKLAQILTQILQENELIRAQNESIPDLLRSALTDLGELRTRYQHALEAKQVPMKMPVERATNLPSSLAILKNSRFIFVGSASQFSSGLFPESVDSQVLSDGGVKISPKLDRGALVTDSAVSSQIGRIHSSNEMLTLAVWPDSYAEFATVKELLVQKHVLYQLWPKIEGEELIVYLGSGPNRAQ